MDDDEEGHASALRMAGGIGEKALDGDAVRGFPADDFGAAERRLDGLRDGLHAAHLRGCERLEACDVSASGALSDDATANPKAVAPRLSVAAPGLRSGGVTKVDGPPSTANVEDARHRPVNLLNVQRAAVRCPTENRWLLIERLGQRPWAAPPPSG